MNELEQGRGSGKGARAMGQSLEMPLAEDWASVVPRSSQSLPLSVMRLPSGTGAPFPPRRQLPVLKCKAAKQIAVPRLRSDTLLEY